ncbi:MAG: META domain-containing protein [Leucobacter sp.]
MRRIQLGTRPLRGAGFSLAGAAIIAAFGLALAGCTTAGSSDNPSPTETQETPDMTEPGTALTPEQLLGAWAADEPGDPRLDFADDGTVSGTDGCNGISTTYIIDGERALLEPFASTLKACIDVDDWLRGIDTVIVDGDTMHVYDRGGEELGSLQRATDAG